MDQGERSPFFIEDGERIMSKLSDPVSGNQHTSHVHVDRFTSGGDTWFPKYGVVKVNENGSMEKDVLEDMMDHINSYIR